MIVKENPVWANATRGTIVVYAGLNEGPGAADWYWQAKSKNGQILAQGEGYKRRASCLNALEALFASRLTDEVQRRIAGVANPIPIVIPWRLVVQKRDGSIEWIGQIR